VIRSVERVCATHERSSKIRFPSASPSNPGLVAAGTCIPGDRQFTISDRTLRSSVLPAGTFPGPSLRSLVSVLLVLHPPPVAGLHSPANFHHPPSGKVLRTCRKHPHGDRHQGCPLFCGYRVSVCSAANRSSGRLGSAVPSPGGLPPGPQQSSRQSVRSSSIEFPFLAIHLAHIVFDSRAAVELLAFGPAPCILPLSLSAIVPEERKHEAGVRVLRREATAVVNVCRAALVPSGTITSRTTTESSPRSPAEEIVEASFPKTKRGSPGHLHRSLRRCQSLGPPSQPS